ncbi:MAG: SPOR domain-containing protein [Comamonas sp.]|jgi:hypothetical protein|uniref:SPOR domain-containing protein n=1 Tax=Comamonas sp. TaxID=34028 RepID=UPI002835C465|nr:SPOR domain-containing protein [Comamonas sp.]MDR0214728.1 SPOR domain-containing protein [Comamonas sp.]MDR2300082.1 SPOR domain-containing protein [Comamonas sp.]
MLRIVFLLLLLGNAGYYMWSHGYLASLGLQPSVQSEPQRLQEQIKPDALTLQAPEPATEQAEEPAQEEPKPEEKAEPKAEPKPEPKPEKADKPEPVAAKEVKEPESCYQASGIEEKQAESIRRALATGKLKSEWDLVASHQGGRWMVYMGKFPDTEFLDRKRGELRLMNIDFDRAGGGFEPGLSLGRFSTEEAAQRQLATFTRQGVRTARVVQERPEITTYALRLPKATPTFRNEVVMLAGKNLLPKALQACPR